jgi:cytidine deaminase
MIAQGGGDRRITRILVAAERHKFTPCGSCMDLIMFYGGPECVVGYVNKKGALINYATAKELMPEYPC